MVEVNANMHNVSDVIRLFKHILRYSYLIINEFGGDSELIDNYLKAVWEFLNALNSEKPNPILPDTYNSGAGIHRYYILFPDKEGTGRVICFIKQGKLYSVNIKKTRFFHEFQTNEFCTAKYLGIDEEKVEEYPPFDCVVT